MTLPWAPTQGGDLDSNSTHRVVSGPPRSGKTAMLVEILHAAWQVGLDGERVLILTPDRRSARRLNTAIDPALENATGRLRAMSYHSFTQDLIRRWWPLVMQRFGIQSATPEFLPFNLTQFACLNEYREDPGSLQRLIIREQRLIVQVLSNMNLSAANDLTLEEGWQRVAHGLGVSSGDEIIQDGLDLTLRFRNRCLVAGVLPLDLQVAAAGWLLADERVRSDLLARVDLLAIDGLDEFVPMLAERLTAVARECRQAVIVHCDDGGLRWLLGASVQTSGRLRDELVAGGTFQNVSLTPSLPEPAASLDRAAAWLADAVAGSTSPAPDGTHWSLCEESRPDKMAERVVETVARLVADGVPPQEIALLIPYMDTLISTEIERGCRQRGIPFRSERRWQSLLDNQLSRACLTALRCVNPGKTRSVTLVEVADLVVALTESNPVLAQPWARKIFKERSGRLQEPEPEVELPRAVRLLARWARIVENRGELHWQLEMLARHVLAPHNSQRRSELVRACYALANEARRFSGAAPRLQLEEPYDERFFDYVDSNVVAADTGRDPDDDAVVLTTPYAFLTSGRSATQQCWLNVASPAWWEPPLLLLTNPHAMVSEPGSAPMTSLDDDRVRSMILGRIIRNLAARCDGQVHAFAAFFDADGAQLDGPLYDYLAAMRAEAVS